MQPGIKDGTKSWSDYSMQSKLLGQLKRIQYEYMSHSVPRPLCPSYTSKTFLLSARARFEEKNVSFQLSPALFLPNTVQLELARHQCTSECSWTTS